MFPDCTGRDEVRVGRAWGMSSFLRFLSVTFAKHAWMQGFIAIGVAALWCRAGLPDIRKGRVTTGISWVAIGAAILIAATIGFIVNDAWGAASIAGAGLVGGTAAAFRYYSRNIRGSSAKHGND